MKSAIPRCGWIGTQHQLLEVLVAGGADTESDGAFKLAGRITSFMGAGDEFVVGPDAVYFVGGEPRSLVAALGGAGLEVQVI